MQSFMDESIDESTVSRIRCEEVALSKMIGSGAFAKVYRARWRGRTFAVKWFNMKCHIDPKQIEDFIQCYAMKIASNPHPNVLKMYAYSADPFSFVMEEIYGVSVHKYVRDTPSKSDFMLDRVDIALQAAKGLQHLHRLNIIHSAISCRNILVQPKVHNDARLRINSQNDETQQIRVVVTDYAWPVLLNGDSSEKQAVRTEFELSSLKWTAPECIENSQDTSFAADIYAFGIAMWEIMTAEEPYSDIDNVESIVDVGVHVVVNDMRPQSEIVIPVKIQKLIERCWHKDKEQRPSIDQVVAILEDYKANALRDCVFAYIREAREQAMWPTDNVYNSIPVSIGQIIVDYYDASR